MNEAQKYELMRKLGITPFTGGEDSEFSGNSFSITINNQGSSAKARRIALSPGFQKTAADIKDRNGVACDAIAAEGEIIDTADEEVTCSSDDSILPNIIESLINLPMQICAMKVKADDASQMRLAIDVMHMTPQANTPLHTIVPEKSKRQSDNDDKVADIPLSARNIVTGQDIAIIANIGAGREVTYIMYYKNPMSYRSILQNLVNEQVL